MMQQTRERMRTALTMAEMYELVNPAVVRQCARLRETDRNAYYFLRAETGCSDGDEKYSTRLSIVAAAIQRSESTARRSIEALRELKLLDFDESRRGPGGGIELTVKPPHELEATVRRQKDDKRILLAGMQDEQPAAGDNSAAGGSTDGGIACQLSVVRCPLPELIGTAEQPSQTRTADRPSQDNSTAGGILPMGDSLACDQTDNSTAGGSTDGGITCSFAQPAGCSETPEQPPGDPLRTLALGRTEPPEASCVVSEDSEPVPIDPLPAIAEAIRAAVGESTWEVFLEPGRLEWDAGERRLTIVSRYRFTSDWLLLGSKGPGRAIKAAVHAIVADASIVAGVDATLPGAAPPSDNRTAAQPAQNRTADRPSHDARAAVRPPPNNSTARGSTDGGIDPEKNAQSKKESLLFERPLKGLSKQQTKKKQNGRARESSPFILLGEQSPDNVRLMRLAESIFERVDSDLMYPYFAVAAAVAVAEGVADGVEIDELADADPFHFARELKSFLHKRGSNLADRIENLKAALRARDIGWVRSWEESLSKRSRKPR